MCLPTGLGKLVDLTTEREQILAKHTTFVSYLSYSSPFKLFRLLALFCATPCRCNDQQAPQPRQTTVGLDNAIVLCT